MSLSQVRRPFCARKRAFLRALLLVSLATVSSAAASAAPIDDWQEACGPTCTKMVAGLYGRDIPIAQIRQRMTLTPDGRTSLLDIRDLLRSYGFYAEGMQVSASDIEKMRMPCIVHEAPDHFVVAIGRGPAGGLFIADPPSSPRLVDSQHTAKSRRLSVIVVATKPIVVPGRIRPRSVLTWLALVLAIGSLVGLIWIATAMPRAAVYASRARALQPLWVLSVALITGTVVYCGPSWGSLVQRLSRGRSREPLRFAQASWDFGTLPSGDKRQRQVSVTNRSRADVFIRSVRADCGCLSAKASHGRLLPGQSARLTLDLDLKGIEGFLKKVVYVTFTSGDGTEHVTRFGVSGFVKGEGALLSFPSICDFGEVVRGSTATRHVVLRRKTWMPFTIVSADADLSVLSTSLAREYSPHGDMFGLDVSLSAGSAPGVLEGVIVVRTNDDKCVARINARARIVEDVQIVPPISFLALKDARVPVQSQCIVRSRSGRPLSLATPTPWPYEDMPLTAAPLTSDGTAWLLSLRATVTGGSTPMRRNLPITVTSDEGASSLTVPVVWLGS